MLIFKNIDRYDQTTGKKIKSDRIPDFEICDFTGFKIDENENPNFYVVNHNSNDPCFGDGEGERWFYDWHKKNYGEDSYGPYYELFGQGDYIFKDVDSATWKGYEVFGELVEEAIKEMEEGIYSLDHLLRWSRGRMLEKVLKEGTYKLEDFIEYLNDLEI